MTRSSEQVVRDLEAQLVVQRTATSVYQAALKRAYDNLRMLGREDVVKAIQRDAITDVREATVTPAVVRAPQPVLETDDDDLF